MNYELETLPSCCLKALEQIRDVMDLGNFLTEFMSIAPGMVLPGNPKTKVLYALFRIGKNMIVSWRKNRKATSETLKPIVQRTIERIIVTKLVRQHKGGELSQFWSRLYEELRV